MQDYNLLKWLTPAAVGLSILCPTAALASESTVEYTPSSTVVLNPNTGNFNIDFGTVHIQSESATGWVLRVRSTQKGNLSHGTHPFAVPYSLTVNGTQVGSLVNGDYVTALTTSTLTCPPPAGCTLPVRATALASDIAGKPAGSYSDRLIFTLINQ
jgi:hypothetical protein